MKLLDVTVPLDSSLPVYPGNTPFTLEPTKRIATGGSSNVSTLHLSTHAGTHVDAPRHYFDDGAGVDALAIELLCGRVRVLNVRSRSRIEPADLSDLGHEDVRVLIRTRNSRLWGSQEFHTDYVGLSEDAARHLISHGVKVVGIDYLSVEEYKRPGAPAHRALLGGGVIVIEGLNLSEVESGIYEMFCLPLRIVGGDGAPARVVLRQS